MKELELKSGKKQELVAKKQQEKKTQLQLDSSIFPHGNHKLWEINEHTLEVVPAEFDLKKDYVFNPNWKKGDKLSSEKALIKREGCVYVSALSKETALKKYIKGDNGSKINKDKALKLSKY